VALQWGLSQNLKKFLFLACFLFPENHITIGFLELAMMSPPHHCQYATVGSKSGSEGRF
jgi:hypothetical protein